MLRELLSAIGLTDAPPPKPMAERSPQWPAVRAAHLLKEPRCMVCDGTKNLQVHHLLPVSWPGGKALELVDSNLLTLCESPSNNHHLLFGHLGDFFSKNVNARADAAVWFEKIRNRPYPGKVATP